MQVRAPRWTTAGLPTTAKPALHEPHAVAVHSIGSVVAGAGVLPGVSRIQASYETRNEAADGGKRTAMLLAALVVLALLAVACGDSGGTPVAPTPVYPEVGGHWEGALHDTRRSAPPEWGLEPCSSLASCADHQLVEADFQQDGATVSGSATFTEGFERPFEFSIQSGTISTDGVLRLTFDEVEAPGPIPMELALTWEAQVDTTGMTGTVRMQSTSDVLPGTAVFEGCLGPLSPAECSGWRR